MQDIAGSQLTRLSYLKRNFPEVLARQMDTQTETDTIGKDGIRRAGVRQFLGELV